MVVNATLVVSHDAQFSVIEAREPEGRKRSKLLWHWAAIL